MSYFQGTSRQEEAISPFKACPMIANMCLFVCAISSLNTDCKARNQQETICIFFPSFWYDCQGSNCQGSNCPPRRLGADALTMITSQSLVPVFILGCECLCIAVLYTQDAFKIHVTFNNCGILLFICHLLFCLKRIMVERVFLID